MSPDSTTPSGGGPANGSHGRRPDEAAGFRVANLLRMQQKLLTGGGPAVPRRQRAGPVGPTMLTGRRDGDGSGPVPEKEARPGGAFEIRDYLDAIVRCWVYLLLPLVLVPVLAWIYTRFQPDEYEAVSRLLLTRSLVGQGVTDDIFSGGGYVTSTALAQVAKLERVRKRAAEYVVAWAGSGGAMTEDESGQPASGSLSSTEKARLEAGPLARLWAGGKPALPEWQIKRLVSLARAAGAPGSPDDDARDASADEGDEQGKPGEDPIDGDVPLSERQGPAAEVTPEALARDLLLDARWAREALTVEEREFLASPEAVFAYVSAAVVVVPDTQNVSVVLTARNANPIVAAAATDALAASIVEEFQRLIAARSSVAIIQSHLDRNQENVRRVNEDIAALRHEAAATNEAVEGFPLELERQYDLLKDHEFNLRSLEYMIEESEQKVVLLRKRATRAAEEVPPPEQLIQRLIDLELKRDEFVARYTDKHPSMRKLRDEIEQTRRAIEQYSERRRNLGVGWRRGLGYWDPDVQLAVEEAKFVGLKARKERLSMIIKAVRTEIEKSTAQARGLKYELLLTSRKVLQDTAVALRTRLHRAQLIEGVDSGPAGGAVEAVVAEVDLVGPRRFQTVFLAVIVGMLAGVTLALLAERLDETVRMPADIRVISGLPTLQVIPYFKKSLVIRPEETVSGIANVFAVLRNHIRYSAEGSPERLVLLTSATSGEGKSLLAVNLAISFAQEGNRTCLVDADIQKGERHALEEAVKLAWNPQVGLAGFLEGAADYDQVICPCLELSNLSFVSSGGRAQNPPRALRDERAADLFGRLQDEFDVVIVDSPPVLPVVDSAILASYCRAVIHIVRHGYTRRGELEESVRRLRHVGAPLVGLILNCAPGSGNGYYGARRYYGQYAV